MVNTHRDFGPMVDGEQERYLSYYGIKRSIKDGATLEVHYIRDRCRSSWTRRPLSVGFETDVRGDGARGRRGQGLNPAAAFAVEGTGSATRTAWRWCVSKMLEHFLELP